MASALVRARHFILTNARLLEQRGFGATFAGESGTGVVDALRGYQNDDGGFGHGLEPDKRCPASLPVDVEFAFDALVAAGTTDATMVKRACDYLQSVSTPEGSVALAFPVIEEYPRAEEWSDWTYVPGVFPTAGLAGLLYAMGMTHPWLDRATAWCWSALDDGLPEDAHAVLRITTFLAYVPDRERATPFYEAVTGHLPKTNWYRSAADDPEYGMTPLHIAPSPDSPWRSIYDDDTIAAHLDRLERDQQDDGGWAITWEPPSPACTFEYRGVETLRALRVLRAYGRL